MTRLRIDRNMVNQFPSRWQTKWNRFQPLGLVDSEFQLDFIKGQWTPRADIHCRDVSFTWDKHPFPVERAAGEVAFRPGQCVFELHSIDDKQPVRFRGEVHQPGPLWTGWVEAFVDRPIPLNDRVLSAMSPSAQRIVRDFSPRGLISGFTRSERSRPDHPPYRQSVIDFRQGTIRHEQFPYPLQNVTAHIERHGNDWQFTKIVGENDGAILTCEGDWQASTDGGSLQLHFAGSDLPLEDELRQALTPTAQHLWAQLRPQGTLDQVQAVFDYELPSRKKQLVVKVRKLPASQSARGHSLSVNPLTFPYRVDNVSGAVTLSNDQLQIEKLRGSHGKVSLTTSGLARVSRDGPWQMDFRPLSVDRLRVDDEFADALPPKMRQLLDNLQLSGPVSLEGKVQFAGNARNMAATRATWDLDVDLEDGQLNAGIPLEHLTGTVHLQGTAGAGGGHCSGNLNIDSMICQGLQLSNVQGPVWIDRERMVLGKRAQVARPGLPPRRLTARVFDGNLSADMEMMLDEIGKFEIAANLENARAIDVTRELCDTRITGQAWADLNLTGNAQGTHTWSGSGTMQLRNTNLYELPFVLSLLKTISTGSSDRTAFSSSDIAFHLKGKHVYFDQLDLQGDSLTMKGVGEMDMQQQLNLDFYTMMGREDSYFPVIRPLLGMASRRFMVVRVSGSASNPIMSREVLPDLNDTLRQLFPETTELGASELAATSSTNSTVPEITNRSTDEITTQATYETDSSSTTRR